MGLGGGRGATATAEFVVFGPCTFFLVFYLTQCDVGIDFPFMLNVVVFSTGGSEDPLLLPEECQDDCANGSARSSRQFCWRVVSCTTRCERRVQEQVFSSQ